MNSDDFINLNINEYKTLITLLDKQFDYEATLKTYTEKINAVLVDPKTHQGHWTRDRVQSMIPQIIKQKKYPLFYQNRCVIFDKELDVAELTDNDEQILVFANTCIQILPYEDCFDVLVELHRRLNHAGVDKMNEELQKHFYISKMYLYLFLQSCNSCAMYRDTKQKYCSRLRNQKLFDAKMLTSAIFKDVLNSNTGASDNLFNDTVKIDFLNMTSKPDGDFRHILIYSDNATRYILLRPMEDYDLVEIAMEIFRIITDYGPPKVIETFEVRLLEHVMKILESTPIELKTSIIPTTAETESNLMVKKCLNEWMKSTSSTNWATGCYIIQSYLNLQGKEKPVEKLFGEKALTMVTTPKFDQNSLWKIIAYEPKDKEKKDSTKSQSKYIDDVTSKDYESIIQLKDADDDDDDDDDDDIVILGDENNKIAKPSTSTAKDSIDTIKGPADMVLNVCIKCKRPIYFEPYNCIACKKFYHYYCAFKSVTEVSKVSQAILCYMCQVSFESQNDD